MTSFQQYQKLKQNASDKLDQVAEQFVSEEIIEIIERSTSYSKIIKSKDPKEFSDFNVIQWDTCTASIFSALRKKFKEQKIVPSQILLIRICKLAARKIYNRHQLIMKLESKNS